jgi:hypothetical protein
MNDPDRYNASMLRRRMASNITTWAMVPSVLASAAMLYAGPVDMAEIDWPSAVQPHVWLMKAAAEYESQRYSWRVVCDERFDGRSPQTWRVPEGEPMALAEQRQIDGRNVTVFQTDGKRAGWIAVGEPVRGDFSIELVGRSMPDADQQPCDLSVFAGRLGYGPGFQFGAWFNKRNLMWVSRSRPGETGQDGQPGRRYREIDLPTDRLIDQQRWHRVRLDIGDGMAMAFVDDELLRAVPLGRMFDASEPLQPHLYIYGTTAAIDRVTVRVRGPLAAEDDDRLFVRCFAGRTRHEVLKDVERVVDLLGHADWPVRDAAHQLLERLGPLGHPALERIAREGTLEQRYRARRILFGRAEPHPE